MTAAKLDLIRGERVGGSRTDMHVTKGCTWRRRFRFLPSSGSPVDYSAWSFAAKIKTADGTEILSIAFTGDAANPGYVDAVATAAATAAATAGLDYEWDLIGTDDGGEVHQLLYGRAEVRAATSV